MRFLNADELEAGLPEILASPKDDGVVSMIVRRPDTDQREVLDSGELDVAEGLVGDNWHSRGSRMTADGSAHPEMQLNLMNTRVISLVARSRERWALAGDQFFVDLDLAKENLPAGTRLAMGSAIIEVTAVPHLGCKKFTSPVRARIDEVRELAARKAALPSGYQCKGRRVRPGPYRGRDPKGVAKSALTGPRGAGRSAAARERLQRKVGEEESVDASAVLAIFNAVVRIADATGTPLKEAKARMSVDSRAALGLEGA